MNTSQKKKNYQVNWDVLYESGKLTAKVYIGNKVVSSDEQITSGKPTKIKIINRYHGKNNTIFELQAIDDDRNLLLTTIMH